MEKAGTSRLTPWVTRLLVINVSAVLLLTTVFTAPRFVEALQFDPAHFGRRPWTAVTYLFVHGGLLHLALTSLALFIFGPPVERKLGGRRFLAYYLYCGVGAAVLALGLSGALQVLPFAGASGALFGILAAFALSWPDTELTVIPFPFPLTARAVFGALVAADVVGTLVVGLTGTQTGIAHAAHLGGAMAGYLFLRIQSLAGRHPPPRPAGIIRRPVVTPMRVQETGPDLGQAPPSIEPPQRGEPSDAEMNRVLDKISQFGIDSLTSEERKFLADVAERKRSQGR